MNTLPTEQSKRRILILTSDSGFGHRRSAESVEKALHKHFPDQIEVQIVNPMTDTNKAPLLKNVDKSYNARVVKSPKLYRIGYRLSDNRQISDVIDSALILTLTASLKEVIGKFQPQAILNTNEIFNSAVGSALDQLNMHMPYFTVVTDFADVHTLWFGKDPDAYFLASDWVQVRALEHKMPPEKLFISGIPVDPKYEDPLESKKDLRKKLKIDPDLTTLLIVGGDRVKNVVKTVKALQGLKHDFQVVAIAGGSDKLYNDLVNLEVNYPLHVEHFTKSMSDWLRAADVLLTKAGGLILSEGLAAGLPILIIHYLPGQEEGNVRFVLSHQAGAHPSNAGEAMATLDYWLKDDAAALKLTAQASKRVGKPGAASQVARTLWNAITEYAESGLVSVSDSQKNNSKPEL